MTAFHLRDSQAHLASLYLALIDPILTILAGLWLVAKLQPIIESWIQHRPLHYVTWAVALWLGCALIASNVMSLIIPVARGFGADGELFKASKPRYLAFWVGVGLVIASHIPSAMQWVTRQDQFPDYDGTIVLSLMALFAFFFGARDFVISAWTAISAAVTTASVESRNRRAWHTSSRQLALCGGIAQGVFRKRNLATGAPAKGTLLLYGERSANRGTIVVGAPGSSKTRSKVYPDFYWGLRTSQRAGAIVFITKKRATE
ncbi:MAG TPA: hypothetical protein VNF68_07455, partial [Candidatus Baltobacteraceae bacterium]|nr:hypothetical protein [Candidatus Baltobacteraceae bacterium]